MRDPFEDIGEGALKDSIWKAPSAPAEEKPPEEPKPKRRGKEAPESGYLLSFKLEKEVLGAEVEHIREVVRVGRITPVPNAPFHVLGVMNLRGRIIPLISLRRIFRMEDLPPTRTSKILIAEDNGKFVGILVDDVTEVMTFYKTEIEPISSLRFGETRFAKGVLRVGDIPIVIIDIREVIRSS